MKRRELRSNSSTTRPPLRKTRWVPGRPLRNVRGVSPLPADNPIVELQLPQLDLSHADLRIVDSQSQSRLVLSIEAQGQLLPVVVVRQDNRNILIDGFARARALRRLGKDTVWALVLAHSEAEALLWCYRQQQGRRPTAIEDGLARTRITSQPTTAVTSDCGGSLPQYELGFPSFGVGQDTARSHSATG